MTDPESSYNEKELELLASLRDLESDDWQLDTPPAHVWAGIERAIREQPAVEASMPTASEPPANNQPANNQPANNQPANNQLASGLVVSGSRWWLVAASIVAVLCLGVGALAMFGGDNSSEVIVTATELSSAGLDGAPEGLLGDASVIETTDGQIIEVDIGDLRPASGEFLEVWLIRPDVSGMVSLGTARPDGRYELPPSLRLADFPIVDVSTEPYDGDPVHSGASLLRGILSS